MPHSYPVMAAAWQQLRRRYREHLQTAAAHLIRRSSDGGAEGGTKVRNLLVANLGPAWSDESLYELFGRCAALHATPCAVYHAPAIIPANILRTGSVRLTSSPAKDWLLRMEV